MTSERLPDDGDFLLRNKFTLERMLNLTPVVKESLKNQIFNAVKKYHI
jgi:hypothetical protein